MSGTLFRRGVGCCALLLCALASAAGPRNDAPPEAGIRTYVQNYKDMVLATCLASAYGNDRQANRDAVGSITALQDYWTAYDIKGSAGAVTELIRTYLARDYSDLLDEPEGAEVRFDFLKCMDLYHSRALDNLAASVVKK